MAETDAWDELTRDMVLAVVVLAGGLLFIAARYLVRAVRLESKDRPQRRVHHRYRRSKGKQVVGATCVTCGEKVKVEVEARFCSECGEAVHLRECERSHQLTAHSLEEHIGPYR